MSEPQDAPAGTTETAVPSGKAANPSELSADYLNALAARIEGGSVTGIKELANENAKHRVEKQAAREAAEKYKAKSKAMKVEHERQRSEFESALTRVYVERALHEAGITPEVIDADIYATAVVTAAKRAEMKVGPNFSVESAKPLGEVAKELAKSFNIARSKPQETESTKAPIVIAGTGGSVTPNPDDPDQHWTMRSRRKAWGAQAEGWPSR